MFQTYRDLFMDITSIKWADVVLSILCMILLYVVKEYANPPFKKKFKAPIPIDLFVVSVDNQNKLIRMFYLSIYFFSFIL